jgi:Zn-dependent protease
MRAKAISVAAAAATIYTLGTAGHGIAYLYAVTSRRPMPSPLWYVGGMLAILLCHEFGHWLAAWRMGLTTSWPLLIPLPVALSAWLGAAYLPPVGTLGALTPFQMPPDPSDRWTVAVAGILSGLAASLTVLLVGRALSPVGVSLGHPLTPWLVKVVLGTVRTWHPLAVAGWLGVLMTGLNLLPVPGLDGWHIWRHWDVLPERRIYLSLALGVTACACLLSF